MEENQFLWEEKRGTKNSQVHHSFFPFPGCFIALTVSGLVLFSEKETPKPHSHLVGLSKLVLLDVVK